MENKKKEAKRYLLIFTIASATLLFAIGLTTYIVDPFFQYRIKDKSYILNPMYNNIGLARHYDYNTVIIGSSMVQNYDLSILREDSLVKPVKLASGSITIMEMLTLYSQTNKDKANTFIINLDVIQFNEWLSPYRYPYYLYSGRMQDKLRYLYAYESVVRYGLVDIALQPYLAVTQEKDIPEKLKLRYNIEDIGNFSLEATYNDVEMIKRMYRTNQTVSSPYTFQMNIRMKVKIDELLAGLELEKYPDKEYIFVLPPYSALYWHITKRDHYYHYLRNNIKYLCRETKKYKNVHIQFFYGLEQISDLNKYSDVTHFDPETSSFMLRNLKNEEYTITTKNMNERLNRLDSLVVKFEKDNADWL